MAVVGGEIGRRCGHWLAGERNGMALKAKPIDAANRMLQPN